MDNQNLEEFKKYIEQARDQQIINIALNLRNSYHSLINLYLWCIPLIPVLQPIADELESYLKIVEIERYRRSLPRK